MVPSDENSAASACLAHEGMTAGRTSLTWLGRPMPIFMLFLPVGDMSTPTILPPPAESCRPLSWVPSTMRWSKWNDGGQNHSFGGQPGARNQLALLVALGFDNFG